MLNYGSTFPALEGGSVRLASDEANLRPGCSPERACHRGGAGCTKKPCIQALFPPALWFLRSGLRKVFGSLAGPFRLDPPISNDVFLMVVSQKLNFRAI
jgi:hypothetical protein